MKSKHVSPSEFVSSFEEFSPNDSLLVDLGSDIPQPIRVYPSKRARSLVILFHGAVNREKREYPPYLNFRAGIEKVAHQISVADSTLGIDDTLSIGWYAGAPQNQLQELLPPLFEQLKNELGVERVVFMGSSGGGFGALYYSSRMPGSAAVVQVPQTNARNYHLPGAIRKYLSTCWSESDERNLPVLDLCGEYEEGSQNLIVYIQSTLDFHHLHDQMLPFISSLPEDMRERVIVKSSFWGRAGHSNVVPFREWEGWLKAVLMAGEWSAESIAATYQDMGIEKTPRVGKVATTEAKGSRAEDKTASASKKPSAQDLSWVSIVADSLMS